METAANATSRETAAPDAVDLAALARETGVPEVLDELERDLVGLAPVKARIRDIAALLLVDRGRRLVGLPAEPGFRVVRQEVAGRAVRYTVESYAVDRPEGSRY